MAAVALRDRIQPAAAAVLQTLQKMKISISLVSGDQRQTTAAFGRELGIASTHAEISPEGKAELIAALQRQGEKVCFVGDGVNDALALEKADLGIAVRSASDLAKESADILLLRSDIQAVPQALILARKTLRTIKQKLVLGIFLQRRRHSFGGAWLSQSALMRRCDGVFRFSGSRQRPAPAIPPFPIK